MFDIERLEDLHLRELGFDVFDIEHLALVPLLFQTGYLTIKSYDDDTMQYKLDFPNYEVKNAFLKKLLDTFSYLEQGFSTSHLTKMVAALKSHDIDRFFTVMQSLFANIKYELHLNYEKYYQTIFYVTFKLIGLDIEAEVQTSAGRIDAVVALPETIYLFEFKINKSAEEALKQIKTNEYYVKYQAQGKEIRCVGVNFDGENKKIGDWIMKKDTELQT